jgi:CRP/FNR family transcriptional regulator
MKHATLPPIPLFQGLSEEQMAWIGNQALRRRVVKGQRVFFEGDPAVGFYVLLSGRVKVSKLSPEGKEQILHLMEPGDPFGEVPVFAGGVFPANAVVLEDADLLFLSRELFLELIGRVPALAMNMLASLSRRLILMTRLVESLSLREVHERLAAYVLHRSDLQGRSDEVSLDINKGLLASLLGTSPETLSRTLTRLHNDGFIEVSGRRIRIRNRSALEEMGARWNSG